MSEKEDFFKEDGTWDRAYNKGYDDGMYYATQLAQSKLFKYINQSLAEGIKEINADELFEYVRNQIGNLEYED